MTFATSSERLQSLRAESKSRTLTLEEVREALTLMRGDRQRAAAVSATSKAKKAPINTADLLSDLENL